MAFRSIVAVGLCVLALAGPARAQATWPADCKLVLAAQLPFHLEGGHLAIDVQVNDTPRQFIVDTGGFTSTVSRKVAEELRLRQYGISANVRIIDAGGKTATHYTQLDSLTIANLRATGIRVMVMESGLLDGLIAPDLLRNFDVEIDFPNRTINFFRPHPCSGKAVYWTDKFSSIGIDITEQGHIRVPVELNGTSLYAMLDTGAPYSIMTADMANKRFGITPQGPERRASGGAGGEFTVSDAAFDSLKIGDAVLQKPAIGLSRGKQATTIDQTSMILGMREMSRFHIYIAYRERTLYLAEESSRPSTALTVSAKTMEPAEAIAATIRAQPAPLAATFTFVVKSTGQSGGQLFLNSEADFRDAANLSVALPLAEANKLGGPSGEPAAYLMGKRITVVGGARRLRIGLMRDGQPTDQFYYQTRITVPSASQVSIEP